MSLKASLMISGVPSVEPVSKIVYLKEKGMMNVRHALYMYKQKTVTYLSTQGFTDSTVVRIDWASFFLFQKR